MLYMFLNARERVRKETKRVKKKKKRRSEKKERNN